MFDNLFGKKKKEDPAKSCSTTQPSTGPAASKVGNVFPSQPAKSCSTSAPAKSCSTSAPVDAPAKSCSVVVKRKDHKDTK